MQLTDNTESFIQLSCDPENHRMWVSASFVYDADGNRVQSTIGGVTTTFVGNYYEVSGSTVTKYYMAGAQRIAVRTGSTLNYLLSDQLGSTDITTDANGVKIAELRYKPWGETRATYGTTPTKYTYTGQYSNMGDFGLMFYNARWYDPAIGRFAQADTVVPDGVQGYDRYAYANNSPIVYSDPTGHNYCDRINRNNADDCNGGESRINKSDNLERLRRQHEQQNGSQDCSISGQASGRSCNPQYMSLALGLDAPTLLMLSGLGLSIFAPEAGVPIGLTGAAIEACAFTATPACAAAKLASLNVNFTYDEYGNIYAGPQISWGKSILPFGAASFNLGWFPTADGHVPTAYEVQDSLQGFAVSAGTIATGGISYSPAAGNNKTAYYMVGAPELFSVNFTYNFLIYDAARP